MVYYNEIDPKAAGWLRELIKAGLIPAGDVDERSICDVEPKDLDGYDQCHFFAGIGGWPYALRLAGWPADRPAWTGSCPCQPLSCAGKRKGHADERHLWPAFHALIAKCRPATVFGEQVASKDGREWLAGVRADLEDLGYACGAADLCAASVGAPHIRQRLFWVGDSKCRRLESWCKRENKPALLVESPSIHWSNSIWLPCADGKARRIEPGIEPLAHGIPARVVRLRGYGNAIVPQVAAEFVKAFMECNIVDNAV